MRALLMASAAMLVLAGCGDSDDAAEAADETVVVETDADDGGMAAADADEAEDTDVAALDGDTAPQGPPPGFGGGAPNPAIEEARRNNPRVGPDITDTFEPDPAVAEQRPPNAMTLGGQTPAFENQTRAPIPAETEDWTLEEVATGLVHPWGLEVMPDGRFLITERPGQMRIVSTDGEMSDPITGVPEVWNQGQGGLFDVALAPDFETSRKIYFAYAEPREDGKSGTTLATATLPEGASELQDVEVIFRMQPAWESPGHFGGRIAIDEANGVLFLTLGERMLVESRELAHNMDNDLGKIVRLNLDGSIPEGNAFPDGEGGLPEIWSWGHRSVQGAAIDPVTGRFWSVEHGPRGGDELNHPEAGKDYGWPIIAYGIDYPGTPMYDYEQARPGMEQPVYYWDPVIAPGGMAFYTGDLFPEWKNDLFVAGEGSMRISRLTFNDDRTRITGEEWLPIGARVREVKTGPDGALYLITEEDEAKLLRIVPG